MIVPEISGAAVTEALRSAHRRKDIESMRKICGGLPDSVLEMIGSGDLELRGDYAGGFEVYTIDREYLWPTPFDGARTDQDRIDVTGKGERTIERVERGVLVQMDTERFWLDQVKIPGVPYEPSEGKS